MKRRSWLLLILMLPLVCLADENSLQLAMQSKTGDELIQLKVSGLIDRRPLPDTLRTPLGSVWKLFVYAYQVDQQIPDKAYICTGENREERYCCDKGKTLFRDEALVKSCGLYFEPQHLGIDQKRWTAYWKKQNAPLWLAQLDSLKPDTIVPVKEMLSVLAQLPAQTHSRRILLDKMFSTPDQPLAGALGGRLRVKTWSWHTPGQPDALLGGFAGWLVDGTPLWASAPGTSQTVLTRYAKAINTVLPTGSPVESRECVRVELFSRYRIKRLEDRNGQPVINSGRLLGDFTVYFNNGNQVAIASKGELFYEAAIDSQDQNNDKSTPRFLARLDREEYVARVLDREAAARPEEAAKALAVAIRTYLQQNADRSGECLQITDSSSHQRVAPRAASQSSKAIAAWTTDLVLAGATVTYHLNKSAPSRLSWEDAVQQANQGERYDAILATAFPRANLTRWDNPHITCQPLDNAESWLKSQIPRWREPLNTEPGYYETRIFTVCRLNSGNPYVDREKRRLYVRSLLSQQDRLDLTHEYLHLAFNAHPDGQNEAYIETLARRLILE